jgi:sarcosine oxidase gamma subunit
MALHHGLAIDRTSCSRFWANQRRVLLTAAAYVLMQELLHAARTHYAPAQITTLRERLLKIGTHAVASARRFVLHLPRAFPGHPRVADHRPPTRRRSLTALALAAATVTAVDVSTRRPDAPITGRM